MHKLVILLGRIVQTHKFQQRWPEFLEQAEALPGLQSEATTRVQEFLYGRGDIHLIHELFFESQEDLQDALDSPQGQAAGEILHQITAGQLNLLTAEHKEETIEHLRDHKDHHVDE
jgi:hypothetical protein